MSVANDQPSQPELGYVEPPSWTPPEVALMARRLETTATTEHNRAILTRLATDDRMQDVWNELRKKSRSTGSFFHLAIGTRSDGSPYANQEDAHADALARLFHFAYCSARDDRRVWKVDEIGPVREKLMQKATFLRNIADEVADDLLLTIPDINNTDDLAQDHAHILTRFAGDIEALQRVASVYEFKANNLLPPDDPKIISNMRGDNLVRGVQTDICSQIQDLFGKRLDGIAATLASVALQKKTTARASRSAFSRQK